MKKKILLHFKLTLLLICNYLSSNSVQYLDTFLKVSLCVFGMGCYLFNSEGSLIGSQYFNYKAYFYLAFSSSNRCSYFSKLKQNAIPFVNNSSGLCFV